MNDISQTINTLLFAQLGGGVLAGLAVGYALKRTVKLALLLLGICLLLLYGLMKAGLITVHWDAVHKSLEHGSQGLAAVLVDVIKDLSASLVGFAGGFFMGLKIR